MATATFRPNLPAAGKYDVDVWYSQGANRARKARYEVHCVEGLVEVTVDQQKNSARWTRLAHGLHFAQGTNGFVRLRNDTGATNEVVIADAVRFRRGAQSARESILARTALEEHGLEWSNRDPVVGMSRVLGIEPRDPRASAELIDLSAFYNASIKRNWMVGSPEINLRALPAGVQTLAGTVFDIRGLVQLAGQALAERGYRYPAAVTNIPIHRTFRRLHVLHASTFNEAEAKRVGAYVLHYVDGRQMELPIVYGEDLRDWWYKKDPHVPRATLAWSYTNAPATPTRLVFRLFKRTWDNPRPEVQVESIDFTSTVSKCSPFLVSMTIDTR